MKKTRIILTIVTTLAALFITCSIAFGSNAVVDSNTYAHQSRFDNCMVIDGVDVSYWQNIRGTIDWNKVKRQGIDYVFIRTSYTGQASAFSLAPDSYFETNYEGAKAAGLMVGVYHYSMATTITEAQKEAKYVLDLLDGRELDMPVIMDYEFAGRLTTAYNSWSSSTRNSKLTSNALAFLKVISDSQYEPMFYSYYSMLKNSLDMELIHNKYRVWLSNFNTATSYTDPFEFWQYTSSGSVTGLSGPIDCNFWYYDNSAEETKSGTTSIKSADISLGTTSYEYTKFKKTPTVTVKYNGTTLKKGTDYKVNYIKNVLAGTGYAMVTGIGKYSNTQLVPFTIKTTDIADGGVISNTIADQTYSGSAKKPTVKVMYTGTTLKKNVDYTVSYFNNTNAGTATIKITGKRNFHGSFTKTFKINKAAPTFTGYSSYTRTISSPDFTINTKCDSGATLTYKSSDSSIATVDSKGTVSFKGGTGTVYITVTSPESDNYKAAEKQVKITVNPDDAGTATITTDASSYDKKVGDDSFNLGASTNSDGALTYTSSNTDVATVDSNGKVTLKGIEGTTTITIKVAATDNFAAASKTVQVTVSKETTTKPVGIINGVQNTTLKASSEGGSGYIRVKWTKSPGYKMDYYEVFRSLKKTSGFGTEAYFTTASGSATSYKNTKELVKGTRYYYKVRGVRVIDGEKYYSQWSTKAYRIAK